MDTPGQLVTGLWPVPRVGAAAPAETLSAFRKYCEAEVKACTARAYERAIYQLVEAGEGQGLQPGAPLDSPVILEQVRHSAVNKRSGGSHHAALRKLRLFLAPATVTRKRKFKRSKADTPGKPTKPEEATVRARPPGRPPKGHIWNASTGEWEPEPGRQGRSSDDTGDRHPRGSAAVKDCAARASRLWAAGSESQCHDDLYQQLTELRSLNVSLNVLKRTDIAKAVKPLRNHSTPAIAELAKQLFSEWKATAAKEIRAQMDRRRWAAALSVGSKCTCTWKGDRYLAKIVAINNANRAKVHFVGWNATWDEWLPRGSSR
jgi:hypothetical protein